MAGGPILRGLGPQLVNISGGIPYSNTPLDVFDIENFVVVGASIMDQAFVETVNSNAAEVTFLSNDIDVNVYNRATSGDDSAALVGKIGGYIAEFQAVASNTMFMIHIGGNNVSAGTGYPDGGTALGDDINSIIDSLKTAGFIVALSTLTWRRPPASNPTDPYNINLIQPIINAKADVPVDLYAPTLANEASWIQADGIHLTSAGEAGMRDTIIQQVGQYIAKSTPVVPEPVVGINTVIQFGPNQFQASGRNRIDGNGVSGEIMNIDMSLIAGATISVTGATNVNSVGKGNLSNPSDSSFSLTNNALLSDSIFVESGSTATVGFSNMQLNPSSTYTVTIVASRDDGEPTKVSEYAIAGQVKTLDATATTPNAGAVFTGILGSELISGGMTFTPKEGSLFAYVSGIEIVETA